jgi:hypothetical protein
MPQQLLVSALIAATDLPRFVSSYKPAPHVPTFMLLESQAQGIIEPEDRQNLLRFELFEPNNPKFSIPPYTSGRVFHRYAELRWETLTSKARIVFSGRSSYLPELPKSQEAVISEKLDGYKPAVREYFLYGKRLDEGQLKRIGSPAQEGDFAEVRIPRLLRYPSVPAEPKTEYLQLVVCEYIALETRTSVAYRFCNLRSYVSPKESERKKSV